MGRKILFIIDMQNDFINGAFGSEDAQRAVPNVIDIIDGFRRSNNNDTNDMIFYTLDTHYENYLNTFEGKNLPVKHCIENTTGWELNSDIKDAINQYPRHLVKCFRKNTFGSLTMVHEASLVLWEDMNSNDEIFICGLCTDICVISNALLLRAQFPNLKITCYKDACAGTSKEAHDAALTIMKSNQIEII